MTRTRRTGSLYWLDRYLHDLGLSATDKVLLLGLANHVNAEDECWPSVTTLAEYAGTSYRTAQRHLAALEDAGRITRLRRRRTDGAHSVYLYRLVR